MFAPAEPIGAPASGAQLATADVPLQPLSSPAATAAEVEWSFDENEDA
jgi:hypothetical protein